MKKPRVEIPRAPNELFLDSKTQIEVKTAKIHGEIFAISNSDEKGPSVQPIEIIGHIYASFYRK